MQNLTEDIEKYICKLFDECEDTFIKIRRKALAEQFECVPSQINYVLRSRFTPEKGYVIESQRGGHGFIRIVKVACDTPTMKLDHIKEIIGNSVTEHDTKVVTKAFQERDLISMRERILIDMASHYIQYISERVPNFKTELAERLNADMLKKMLQALMITGAQDSESE